MQAINNSEQLAKAENEVDILSEQLAICKQKNRLEMSGNVLMFTEKPLQLCYSQRDRSENGRPAQAGAVSELEDGGRWHGESASG
jgi:hypothetical protein